MTVPRFSLIQNEFVKKAFTKIVSSIFKGLDLVCNTEIVILLKNKNAKYYRHARFWIISSLLDWAVVMDVCQAGHAYSRMGLITAV